jgi:uncharacterized membrane protein (DUF106 family)
MAIGEFIQSNPRIAIIILAFLVTLAVTLINYFMVDKEKMKEIKARQKELRQEMKKYRDNPQKMMEINKKMLEDMPEQMKHSLKPMLITFIPLIILFKWLWSAYSVTPVATKFLFFPVWTWWYIIASIIFSLVLRKAFKLQ